MANAEELLTSSTTRRKPDPAEEDEDAETAPDFLSFVRPSRQSKIPSRGDKDFEYHGTQLQVSTLDASRQAMHDVLSDERFHGRDVDRAVWDAHGPGAWVFHPRAKWSHAMGSMRYVPGREVEGKKGLQRLFLLPEEMLWAIDRGSLDVRWPAEEGQDEDDGLPMSIQAAYATVLGHGREGGLTLEQYTVYQYLRRAGYYVLRAADNWHNVPISDYEVPKSMPSTPDRDEPSGLWRMWQKVLQTPTVDPNRFAKGPLVGQGLYRDYATVWRLTSLIPWHDPFKTPALVPPTDGPSITYHVYKPCTNYRKSNPGRPDFYISVIDAQQNLIPTEKEIECLLRQTPFHEPASFADDENIYSKLRRGTRDVILAVVEHGVTSFIKLADAGFGNHALFEQKKRAPRKVGGGKKFKTRHRQNRR